MVKKYALIPTGDNVENAIEIVLEAFSKSGVSLKECLDSDSSALCASDMVYFPQGFYGMVPSYAIFITYLNKLPVEVKDKFMETVAEIESQRFTGEMEGVAKSGDYSRDSQIKFSMYSKLNGVYERQLDRLDKRRKARGESEARGIDMAARLISALNNIDLVNLKNKVEIIDAEYKEVADGE